MKMDEKKEKASLAYYSALRLKERNKKIESDLKDDSDYAYRYAKDIVKGRFEEGEIAISKDANYSYLYATIILKKRFELGEKVMRKEKKVWEKYKKEILD